MVSTVSPKHSYPVDDKSRRICQRLQATKASLSQTAALPCGIAAIGQGRKNDRSLAREGRLLEKMKWPNLISLMLLTVKQNLEEKHLSKVISRDFRRNV